MIEDLIKRIDAKENLLLTGPAGTGKSTLIKALKEKYGRYLAVTATTGIAALNIGGGTIHSFSGIGIHTDPRAVELIKNQFNWTKIRKRIQKMNVVIIDEVSMLREDQLQLIDLVFKAAMRSQLPFGGKVMIFVGDFLQLPPVEKSGDKHGWIFDSQTWKDANIHAVHLYTIYRQTDIPFVKNLTSLRFGWCDEETNDFFKSRCVVESELELDMLRFFATNAEAEHFNLKNLETLPTEIQHHKAYIEGQSETHINQLKKSILALEDLELKVGARVMFLTNYKPEDSEEFFWVNGSLGTIVDYKRRIPIVEIDDTKRRHEVEPYTWTLKDWDDNTLASFEQIPLKLAYGVTIHKSQGLTLGKAVIDCKRIFADGQAYVALSRVRSSEGLFLLNWNPRLVRANQDAVEFYLKSMGVET